jgi:hypothetical protein
MCDAVTSYPTQAVIIELQKLNCCWVFQLPVRAAEAVRRRARLPDPVGHITYNQITEAELLFYISASCSSCRSCASKRPATPPQAAIGLKIELQKLTAVLYFSFLFELQKL